MIIIITQMENLNNYVKAQQDTVFLSKQDATEVIETILKDINSGVFDRFIKLKNRLLYIVQKLQMSIYLINVEYGLSESEVKTLVENDYMEY